jgi:hypothetical protein
MDYYLESLISDNSTFTYFDACVKQNALGSHDRYVSQRQVYKQMTVQLRNDWEQIFLSTIK